MKPCAPVVLEYTHYAAKIHFVSYTYYMHICMHGYVQRTAIPCFLLNLIFTGHVIYSILIIFNSNFGTIYRMVRFCENLKNLS